MIGHGTGSRLRCDDPNNLLGFIILGMIYLPCPPMSHSKRELDITILLPGRGRGRFSRKKPKRAGTYKFFVLLSSQTSQTPEPFSWGSASGMSPCRNQRIYFLSEIKRQGIGYWFNIFCPCLIEKWKISKQMSLSLIFHKRQNSRYI